MQLLRNLEQLPEPIQSVLLVATLFLLWQFYKIISFIFFGKRYKYLPKYGGNLSRMKEMDWKKFEFLCEELFRARGWKTKCSSKEGADGGVDVWAERKGEKALIQCKRYKNTSVGVKVVRELYGLMIAEGAQSGYVVTTSRFTKEAFRFAKGKRISLIDGKQLAEISKKLQKAKS